MDAGTSKVDAQFLGKRLLDKSPIARDTSQINLGCGHPHSTCGLGYSKLSV